MKKSYIAILCAVMLCLSLLAGCGGNGNEESQGSDVTDSGSAAETDDAGAVKSSDSGNDTDDDGDVSPSPSEDADNQSQQSSSPDETKTKDFTLEIDGQSSQLTMTYMEFDLSSFGGPTVGMYVDTDRYESQMFEGEYDVVPIDSGEDPDSSIHICFLSGKTADECADEDLGTTDEGDSDAGLLMAIDDDGDMELDNCTAHSITLEYEGATTRNYYIDVDGGVICVSIYVENEVAEEGAPRLDLMARSVVV